MSCRQRCARVRSLRFGQSTVRAPFVARLRQTTAMRRVQSFDRSASAPRVAMLRAPVWQPLKGIPTWQFQTNSASWRPGPRSSRTVPPPPGRRRRTTSSRTSSAPAIRRRLTPSRCARAPRRARARSRRRGTTCSVRGTSTSPRSARQSTTARPSTGEGRAAQGRPGGRRRRVRNRLRVRGDRRGRVRSARRRACAHGGRRPRRRERRELIRPSVRTSASSGHCSRMVRVKGAFRNVRIVRRGLDEEVA